MTDAVINRMKNPEHVRLLQFIRFTLAAAMAQSTEPSTAWGQQELEVAVDVERLFAAVELLVERNNQPWSPFVGAWHAGLESFAPPPSVRRFDLSSELNNFASTLASLSSEPRRFPSPFSGKTAISDGLGKVIEKALAVAQPTDVGELLAEVRDEMLRSLFDVLRIDELEKVSYLEPLVALSRKQGFLTIATLNYDRSIENAADQSGESYDTGIETWLTRGALKWPESGLRLLKLHGSIDWVVERGGSVDELPMQHIRKVVAEEKALYERPAVVFGESGKLRSEGPYLELLLAWSGELQRIDSLLVVGYSFRDIHVNEIIARWFNSSPIREITIIDTNPPSPSGYDSFSWRLGRLAESSSNDTSAHRPRVRFVLGAARDVLSAGIAAASPAPESAA